MDTPLVLLKGRGIRIRPKLKSSNVSSRKQLTNIQTLSALVLKFKSVAPQQLDMTWPKIPACWIWETTAVPLGTPDCTHPPLAVAAVAAKGLNSIRGRSASACTTWEQGQNLDFSWRLFTVVYIYIRNYTDCFRQAQFECKIPQCLYKSFQVSLHCNDLQLVEGHLAESVKLDVPISRDSSAMINSKHFQTHLQEWFHGFVICAFQSLVDNVILRNIYETLFAPSLSQAFALSTTSRNDRKLEKVLTFEASLCINTYQCHPPLACGPQTCQSAISVSNNSKENAQNKKWTSGPNPSACR